MKKVTYGVAGLMVAASLALPVVGPVTTAYAAPTESKQQLSQIEIPINTVERGPAGERTVLATKAVENGEYIVTVTARNQSSVHPDSNLYVQSGDSVVKVADVERKANQVMEGNGTLNVTNGQVVIELEMGPDKVFSGGMTVVLEEKPQPPVVEEPEEPEVEQPTEPTPEVPAELPKTGIASGAFGVGALAYAAQLYVTTRRK